MLDLIHIRSFVALATELHFGRAARHLNMTQPPLSRQIQRLEEYLGTQLFIRTSHSVEPTAAGRNFLPEAIALLRRSAEAEQVARQAKPSKAGALTLGFIGASTYGLLPRLIAAASSKIPFVAITLKEMTSIEQINALAFGEIDMGLVRAVAANSEIESEPVAYEDFLVALPLQNPLAQRQRLTLEDLGNEPFIMYHQDAPYLHGVLMSAFRMARVFPPVVQSLTHAQAILSLVSVGLGVAIVPEDARHASFDNIVFRPIRLGNGVRAEMHVICRADNRNFAVPLLRDLAKAIGGISTPS
jgi:DNA-binding transcriptional LysR family regulator